MIVRGVTSTCTPIWCCPATHKYQAASLSCSFFRVTRKVLILSSLMATEESSKLPSPSVSRQELQSPLRHHFFTLALPTGSHRGSQREQWLSVSAQLRLPVTKQPVSQLPSVTHAEQWGEKTYLYFALYVHPTVMLLPTSPITWLLSTDKPARRKLNRINQERAFPNAAMQLALYFTFIISLIYLAKLQHKFFNLVLRSLN